MAACLGPATVTRARRKSLLDSPPNRSLGLVVVAGETTTLDVPVTTSRVPDLIRRRARAVVGKEIDAIRFARRWDRPRRAAAPNRWLGSVADAYVVLDDAGKVRERAHILPQSEADPVLERVAEGDVSGRILSVWFVQGEAADTGHYAIHREVVRAALGLTAVPVRTLVPYRAEGPLIATKHEVLASASVRWQVEEDLLER